MGSSMAAVAAFLLLKLSVATLASSYITTCSGRRSCDNVHCTTIVPNCTCPPGYTGDPFTHCSRFDPEELCHPSPCGVNTLCEVYHGSPIAGCRDECDGHAECGPQMACGTCGNNARCTTIRGLPVCSCLKGYTGDPLYNCIRAECLDNSECRSHLICKNERCVDPCQNDCGANATCETRNHVPICTCPPGYTGDPFTHCRRIDPEELCHPSPCGVNTLCEVVNNVPTCKCEPGYHGSPIAGCRDECDGHAECGPQMACGTCGNNARCTTIRGLPVCSCLKGYTGDPLYNCIRAECLDNSECRSHLICKDERCVDPCQNDCGANATCETRNHVPICTCPPGYTGDPFTHCRRIDPEELCHPSPCGVNTLCEVVNNVPTCKCEPGYHGSPLAGCRHECENNAECGPLMACIEFKCQNPCSQCGLNADCEVVQNHVPVCKCPRGYFGNPLSSCQPECTQDSDCPPGKPTCSHNSCKNPCDGACGISANCELRNGITPVCSCPRDMTGDPFVMCRPFTKEDLCEPNPCGANAKCQPEYDRYNKEWPVCTCHPGYIGDPIKECVRGECIDDNECPDHQSCFEYKCQNPCLGKCGLNADCEIVQNHVPVCKCPRGYSGNPLSSCQLECTQDSDCPPGKPACFYNSCKNPCDGVCGISANCELRNGITPVCSCPKDMTGNPFVICRPFTKEEFCEPNPCGANAKCQPGYDRYNKERPVCTCQLGYIGDPIKGCVRG